MSALKGLMALATASDENIDHEIMGQMVTLLEAKNGVAGYAQFLKERLEGWKEYLLRIIALTGSSGQEIIKEKARFLRDKIWKVASCSRLLGAVPIIGTSLVGDAPIVYKCYEYYNQASGLDDGSLTTLANIHNTTIAAIKAYMSSTVWSGIFLGGQVASFIII
ncbi:unnamed protein product [Rotaria magnacalcarata]|uniref:Uncharacterized protein n=1 Tax=Rotaria magnacalcarata TaxID=392030 RepID=A0A816NRN5_9BILA|nr:unnamed protein product [Rotaria magnacalcarata]